MLIVHRSSGDHQPTPSNQTAWYATCTPTICKDRTWKSNCA